jgi:hypothetical protein
MKKIISVLVLILVILMLEFNFFEGWLPDAHAWIEIILAFLVLIAIIVWNKLHTKKPVQ